MDAFEQDIIILIINQIDNIMKYKIKVSRQEYMFLLLLGAFFILNGCKNKSLDGGGGSIVAKYEVNLKADPPEGGTVAPMHGKYKAGTNLAIKATPSEDFKFVNWSGDFVDSSKQATITVDENKEITAHFKPIVRPYPLSVNVVGDGSVIKDPDKNKYLQGTIVKLTANPGAGQKFFNWRGDVPDDSVKNNPLFYQITPSNMLTAVFIEDIPPCQNFDNALVFTLLKQTPTEKGDFVAASQNVHPDPNADNYHISFWVTNNYDDRPSSRYRNFHSYQLLVDGVLVWKNPKDEEKIRGKINRISLDLTPYMKDKNNVTITLRVYELRGVKTQPINIKFGRVQTQGFDLENADFSKDTDWNFSYNHESNHPFNEPKFIHQNKVCE